MTARENNDTNHSSTVTHIGADTGAEAITILGDFAVEHQIESAQFSAIGAFERATIGWFDRDYQAYKQIEVDEPCEVLSLLGGIALGENGPEVRAQVVLGLADGRTRGGVLLSGTVGPSLDIVVGAVQPPLPTGPVAVSLRARSAAIVGAIALILLGAWGALSPFVGPSFDFGIGANATWQWSSARGWLEVLPGVIAAVGGLVMLVSASRLVVMLGAGLAAAAGVWFIIGTSFASLLHIGAVGSPIGSRPGIASLEWLGLFYGLGATILALVAFLLGRLSTSTWGTARPSPVAAQVPLAAVAPAPAGELRARWEGVAAAH